MEMKKIIRNCLAICAFITILVACQQITESKLENDYFEYDTENNQYIRTTPLHSQNRNRGKRQYRTRGRSPCKRGLCSRIYRECQYPPQARAR